jgi:hypothetical protein
MLNRPKPPEFQAMDSISVCSVNDMPKAEKRSIESLVGRQLEDSQQVFIMAFTPGIIPSDKARSEAMSGLSKTWDRVDRHIQAHGVTEEEFDAAMDEAVESVRHRKD